MNTVYFDSKHSDEMRRKELYRGQIYVFSPRASTRALCDFAKEMIEESFGGLDPLEAQFHMSVDRYVEIAAALKPRFIHHQRTKGLVCDILEELGCSLERTYQDVPRLRMVTSDGYLTSGVGYAHHPHRDTWYSAPMSQLNWWLPIYDFATEASMAFHPEYWSRSLKNGSSEFNYYEWNTVGRMNASKHVTSDTRKQPKPLEPVNLEPQTRVVCEPGGAILFSAAHLHSTVPNTSGRARYSIDFRTVHADEVESLGGAPNIDSLCTGTSLRDFRRAIDLAPFDEQVVARYDAPGASQAAILTFDGQVAQAQLRELTAQNATVSA